MERLFRIDFNIFSPRVSTKLAFISVLVCEHCGKGRASQKCYTLIFPRVLSPTYLQCGSFRLKQAKWFSMASTPEKKDTFSNEIKPHAIRRNFAGHQLPKFLHVTCRVRLHTLLHVVACCWELLRKVWNHSHLLANNSQNFFCSVIPEA